jgi:hypothetical protein
MAKKSQGRGAGKAASSRGRGAGRGARNSNRGGGSDERTGYSQKIRERQIAKNTKKGGCVPKLFMLLLPFAAVGTYFLLRS